MPSAPDRRQLAGPGDETTARVPLRGGDAILPVYKTDVSATARRCAIPATFCKRRPIGGSSRGQHLRAWTIERDDAPLSRRQSPYCRPAARPCQRVHRRGSGGQRHYQNVRRYTAGNTVLSLSWSTMHPRPTSPRQAPSAHHRRSGLLPGQPRHGSALSRLSDSTQSPHAHDLHFVVSIAR